MSRRPSQPQRLPLSAHTRAAHPQPATPPMPINPPATRRQFKITKNWVIAFLGLMIIGLAGNLHDKIVEINDLKARPAVIQTTVRTQDQVRSYNDGWLDAKADDGR